MLSSLKVGDRGVSDCVLAALRVPNGVVQGGPPC